MGVIMRTYSSPVRVVVVDDDIDDLFLARIAFKKSGIPFEFTGLSSGSALFNHINEQGLETIDILFIDVNMPALNGHEVLAELSTYKGFSNNCVIMVSLEHDNIDEEISGHLGADAYIVKPENLAEMKAFIKQSLDIYESYRDSASSGADSASG